MNKLSCILIPATLTAVLSLMVSVSSCSKEDSGSYVTGPAAFSVSGMVPDTRADLYSGTLTTQLTEGIGVIGIDNAAIPSVLIDNEQATYNSTEGKWKTSVEHTFTEQKLNYAAYYPYGSSAITSLSASTTALTFTYTVPTEASDQKDVMVGYNDNSGNGFLWLQEDVNITMSHALVGIKFIYGDDLAGVSGKTVDSLRISGVYATQSCTATFTSPSKVTFSWGTASNSTTVKGKTTTTGSAPGNTPTQGRELGVVFALIKQDFASATLPKLYAKLSDGNVVSCDFPAATNWESGKIYTYTIDFPVLNVPMAISDADVTVTGLRNGGTTELKYD